MVRQEEPVRNLGTGERRYLCSDLVEVEIRGHAGRQTNVIGNLEEIWSSGAVLLLEIPVPRRSRLAFRCRQTLFHATVTSCARQFLGYFVELRFDAGWRWSRRKVRPKHLFDPATLLPRAAHREPAA